jgi:hypothetical protein
MTQLLGYLNSYSPELPGGFGMAGTLVDTRIGTDRWFG